MSAKDELKFYWPDVCPDGQAFAENFPGLLEMYDALERPEWIEWLLTRAHPLDATRQQLYFLVNQMFAAHWGIFQDSTAHGKEFNHDCCAALRIIVGDGFRAKLSQMHEMFKAIEAVKGQGATV